MRNVNRTLGRLKDIRVSDLRTQVSDVAGTAAAQVADATRQAGRYVRSNPWQSAGLLALAGLAAGFLLTNGSRRSRRAVGSAANGGPDTETTGG